MNGKIRNLDVRSVEESKIQSQEVVEIYAQNNH
jgi:hypothetical protein